MAELTLRSVKGSPLTHAEMDGNFTALNDELASGGGGREVLTADRTYYVSPTGNDAADGLSVETPFATVQRALDVVGGLDALFVQGAEL